MVTEPKLSEFQFYLRGRWNVLFRELITNTWDVIELKGHEMWSGTWPIL